MRWPRMEVAGRVWRAVRWVAGARPRLPKEAITNAVTKYEAFTGVHEIRNMQKNVVAAQEKFLVAQEDRRQAGDNLIERQVRLKAIHDEMQNVSKGDPNYLKLITEEHKIIVEEEVLRNEFARIEKQEREYFTAMSAAVKMSHETERMYAEKNKYLYLLASLAGTVLGVLGSTINNKIKMAEFKQMIMEERDPSKIFNLKFGSQNNDKKLADLESRILAISTNQKTILDYIIKIERMIEFQFEKTKSLVQTTITSKQDKNSNNGFINLDVVRGNQNTTDDVKQYAFYSLLGLVALILVGKIVT